MLTYDTNADDKKDTGDDTRSREKQKNKTNCPQQHC